MGIWIELGVFLLVFVWALWQFHDLKKERLKREARQRAMLAQPADTPVAGGMSTTASAPADATGSGSADRQAR